MENQTNDLTVRQTLVFAWDQRTQWYGTRVEPDDGPEPPAVASSDSPVCHDQSVERPPDVRTRLIKEWDARERRWTITGEGEFIDQERNRTVVDGWAAGLAWPLAPTPVKALADRLVLWFICLATPLLVATVFRAAARGWFDWLLITNVVFTAGPIILLLWLIARKLADRQHTPVSGPIVFLPESYRIANKAPVRTTGILEKVVVIYLTSASWAIVAVEAVTLPSLVNRAVADLDKSISSDGSYGFRYVFVLFAAAWVYFSILAVLTLIGRDAWRKHRAARLRTAAAASDCSA